MNNDVLLTPCGLKEVACGHAWQRVRSSSSGVPKKNVLSHFLIGHGQAAPVRWKTILDVRNCDSLLDSRNRPYVAMRSARIDESPTRRKQRCNRTERRAKKKTLVEAGIMSIDLGRFIRRPTRQPTHPANQPRRSKQGGFLVVTTPYRQTANTWGSRGIFNP
jgi:hypothetical protein